MTLITNEIHMLDGFRNTALIFAADRRLSGMDGSYHGTAQKLFQIPYFRGGISFFGLAEFTKSRKSCSMSEFLRVFVSHNVSASSLEEFCQRLKSELEGFIPETLLAHQVSGFHVCGYGVNGLPEFWFLSNILAMDDFRYTLLASRYNAPSSDFLARDAPANGWNGKDLGSIKNYVQCYRNGDYRMHAVAWERLDQILADMSRFSDMKAMKNEHDYTAFVTFKMKIIADFYKKFSKTPTIGTPIDVFVNLSSI